MAESGSDNRKVDLVLSSLADSCNLRVASHYGGYPGNGLKSTMSPIESSVFNAYLIVLYFQPDRAIAFAFNNNTVVTGVFEFHRKVSTHVTVTNPMKGVGCQQTGDVGTSRANRTGTGERSYTKDNFIC